MKKSVFKTNNKIILGHLKISWKLILFFTLFWLGLTALMFGCLFIKDNIHSVAPLIGKYDASQYKVNASTGDDYSSSGILTISIADYLNWNFFGATGILFFGVFLLLLINKYFIYEIKNKQIMLWLSLSSRKQILYSKISFFIIANIIVFIPSFIIIIVFSAISYDASEYFWYVFLYGIEFFVFIILLVCVFSLIQFILINKELTGIIINSLLIFWMFLCASLVLFAIAADKPSLEYIKYFSPFSLVISPLQFSNNIVGNKIIWNEFVSPNTINEVRYDIFENIKKNKILISFLILLMLLASTFAYLFLDKTFTKKDLNI